MPPKPSENVFQYTHLLATTIINENTRTTGRQKNTMKMKEKHLDFGRITNLSVSNQFQLCFKMFLRRPLVESFAEKQTKIYTCVY